MCRADDRRTGSGAGGVPPGRRLQGPSSHTICGSSPDRSTTRPALIRYGLAVIGERSGEASRRASDETPRRGVIATVRTYESPLDRRLEEQAFRRVAQVSLLMKETLVRVADPALLPATTR